MLLTKLSSQLSLELVNPQGLLGLCRRRVLMKHSPKSNCQEEKLAFLLPPRLLAILSTQVLGTWVMTSSYLPGTARPARPDLSSHTYLSVLKRKRMSLWLVSIPFGMPFRL